MKYFLFFILLINTLPAEICTYDYFGKTIEINTTDKYGCEYDNRQLKYTNELDLNLSFRNYKNSLQLYSGEYLFDVYPQTSPADTVIRLVYYNPKKDIIGILYGYSTVVEEEGGIIGIDSAFYSVVLYKKILNFIFPILKDSNEIRILSGKEGFYHGVYEKYAYKMSPLFSKKIDSIQVSDTKILKSFRQQLNLSSSIPMKDSLQKILKQLIHNTPITSITKPEYQLISKILKDKKYNQCFAYLNNKLIK